MEPVIKKSPYHHVLLMRDDKEVVSFKVHSKVLWYSLACSIVLVTLGLTGTIYGVKTWQKSHSLKAKYETTSSELVEARLQLEQLSNLQTLIATSDSPAPVFKFNEIQMPLQREGSAQEGSNGNDGSLTNADNAAMPGNGTLTGSEGAQAQDKAPSATDVANNKQKDTASADTTPRSGEAGEVANSSAAQAANGQHSDGTNPAMATPSTLAAGEALPTADPAQTTAEQSLETKQVAGEQSPQHRLITDDNSPVRINNLFSKNATRNRIQLSFDLVTNKQDAFVRGETTYQIELQDGAVHNIKPNFLDDSRFAISRMKNFDLTANLPQGIKSTQIKNILISVTLDSGETFSSSYPFDQ